MESENINTQPEENGGRTFTQEDVNRIVSDRLAKDRAKNDAELNQREKDLQQRELHISAKEILTEKGLPVQLLQALNCADMETMKNSIDTIEKIFNDYKANTSKLTFRGFQPGVSSDKLPDVGAAGDLEIRKAMGLRT